MPIPLHVDTVMLLLVIAYMRRVTSREQAAVENRSRDVALSAPVYPRHTALSRQNQTQARTVRQKSLVPLPGHPVHPTDGVNILRVRAPGRKECKPGPVCQFRVKWTHGGQFIQCLRVETEILLFRVGNKRPHIKLKLFHSRCSFIVEKSRPYSVSVNLSVLTPPVPAGEISASALCPVWMPSETSEAIYIIVALIGDLPGHIYLKAPILLKVTSGFSGR